MAKDAKIARILRGSMGPPFPEDPMIPPGDRPEIRLFQTPDTKGRPSKSAADQTQPGITTLEMDKTKPALPWLQTRILLCKYRRRPRPHPPSIHPHLHHPSSSQTLTTSPRLPEPCDILSAFHDEDAVDGSLLPNVDISHAPILHTKPRHSGYLTDRHTPTTKRLRPRAARSLASLPTPPRHQCRAQEQRLERKKSRIVVFPPFLMEQDDRPDFRSRDGEHV